MNDKAEIAKHFLDGSALIVALTTFVGILPNIAAALSVIWLVLRILNEIHIWRNRKR